MKKALIIALVFSLLLIPTAYAQNHVQTPMFGSSYNLGDNLTITGQITMTSSLSGAKVKFYAKSDELGQEYEITTKFYSFTANVTTSFSQINKELLTWKLPADMNSSNDWVISADVHGATALVHRVRSEDFTITNRFSTIFGMNQHIFNLGESFELSGTVLDARGNPASGSASIKLVEDSAGKVLSDSVDFDGGYLTYSYQFKATDPTGNYTFELDLTDSDGNWDKLKFTDITTSNTLPMDCSVRVDNVAPGDMVAIIGNLKDIHDKPIEENPVTALVTDPTLTTSVKYDTNSDGNGNFAFDIEINEQALPGEYKADLEAKDNWSNKGECVVSFLVGVNKEAEAALIILNKTWYYPDEGMNLTLKVKNTGNVDLEGDLEIRVDGLKKVTREFSIEAGKETELLQSWEVTGDLGNHSIQLRVVVDDETLTETMPQQFTIVRRPKPPSPLNYILIAIVLVAIMIIIVYLLYKKQDIKERLWHRELKRSLEP